MGLPIELMPYAENFYRRFPEEFIALGAPGLGEIFDLRPNGTWSRRIHETPTEKMVEITIRRWQPGWPPPYAPMHGYNMPAPADCRSSSPSSNGFYGGPPPVPTYEAPQAYPLSASSTALAQPPARRAPEWQEAATGRLARLENALSLLKPSIEALLTSQAMGQAAPQAPPHQQDLHPGAPPLQQAPPVQLMQQMQAAQPAAQQSPMSHRRLESKYTSDPARADMAAHAAGPPKTNNMPVKLTSSSGAAGSADESEAAAQNQVGRATELSLDGNELRSRRGVGSLAIQTSPENMTLMKATEAPAAKHVSTSVVKLQEQDQANEKEKANEENKATAAAERQPKQRERPRVDVAVIPQRIAPHASDPASPRSPGRFSAWK